MWDFMHMEFWTHPIMMTMKMMMTMMIIITMELIFERVKPGDMYSFFSLG